MDQLLLIALSFLTDFLVIGGLNEVECLCAGCLSSHVGVSEKVTLSEEVSLVTIQITPEQQRGTRIRTSRLAVGVLILLH